MTPVVIEIHATGTGYVAGIVGDNDHYELTRTSGPELLTREDAIEAAYELVLVDDERVSGVKDCDISGCHTCASKVAGETQTRREMSASPRLDCHVRGGSEWRKS